MTYRFKF